MSVLEVGFSLKMIEMLKGNARLCKVVRYGLMRGEKRWRM